MNNPDDIFNQFLIIYNSFDLSETRISTMIIYLNKFNSFLIKFLDKKFNNNIDLSQFLDIPQFLPISIQEILILINFFYNRFDKQYNLLKDTVIKPLEELKKFINEIKNQQYQLVNDLKMKYKQIQLELIENKQELDSQMKDIIKFNEKKNKEKEINKKELISKEIINYLQSYRKKFQKYNENILLNNLILNQFINQTKESINIITKERNNVTNNYYTIMYPTAEFLRDNIPILNFDFINSFKDLYYFKSFIKKSKIYRLPISIIPFKKLNPSFNDSSLLPLLPIKNNYFHCSIPLGVAFFQTDFEIFKKDQFILYYDSLILNEILIQDPINKKFYFISSTNLINYSKPIFLVLQPSLKTNKSTLQCEVGEIILLYQENNNEIIYQKLNKELGSINCSVLSLK